MDIQPDDSPFKNKKIDRFTISLKIAAKQLKDITLQIDAKEERVKRIVDNVRVGDHPVIAYILSITKDREDLERIAKALNRIAPEVAEIQELQTKQVLLKMALERPHEFALMLGDFSSEIDALTASIGDTDAPE